MKYKLDLSKVTKEASKYLIERWELALSENKFLTVDQQTELKTHIDSHLVHMELEMKYNSILPQLEFE